MKKSHTDFLVIIHIRLSEKVEEEEQKRTDPSVLGVLRALPWLLWHWAQTQCPGYTDLRVEMKLHAYSQHFGSVSYHFVDDYDEELIN